MINRCSEELWVIFVIDVHATNIVNIGMQKMAYALGYEISDFGDNTKKGGKICVHA